VSRSAITEYGLVFTDDKSTVRDKRWFYTSQKTFCHIDGNPLHPSNDGIHQMARNHCLASIANHANKRNANACYKEKDRLATPRAILEICSSADAGKQVWPCTILYATKNIYPGQQILTDYENHSSQSQGLILEFRNESLLQFLSAIRKALKDGVDQWRTFPKAEK
jgi:hypothetical protein